MNTRQKLDIDFVRQQFPTSRWNSAFFENAGGAFVPNSVIDRMRGYMVDAQVQTGYPFPQSVEASNQVDLGHSAMASFIGADLDEVTLGASTSMNIYVLAQALRSLWKPGDEIIVSIGNHESNSGPWRRLEEFGLKIIDWPVDPETAELHIDALQSRLSDKTRLVAFPHVSNITGDINDVEAITSLCHEHGAMVCVDGVAYAPHRSIDVKKWDVDFYLFSFYKVFGPHLGLLYAKKDILAQCKGQYHYFFPEDDLPHKLNPAGPNHETIACLSGIADYIDALHGHHFSDSTESFSHRSQQVFSLIADHEEELARVFLEFVRSQTSFRLIGTSSDSANARVPTFSLQHHSLSADHIALALAENGLACGSGHFYAKRMLDSMNLPQAQVLRCSMSHYNSHADVLKLISHLERFL